MASLNLCPQFETNLMSNRNIIELPLQLKSAKAHGKNYIKVKAHLVRHLLRNRLSNTLMDRNILLLGAVLYMNIYNRSKPLFGVGRQS